MSVIADLLIPAHEFELGRILEVESGVTVSLEEMVPLGETAVPFFSVRNGVRDSFERDVRDHPSVEAVRELNARDGVTFYSLDWRHEHDALFEGIRETQARLLSATGTATTWEFELRFPDHEVLSAFQEYCSDAELSPEVKRVYNPTDPEGAPWFGLTEPQRDTLVRAVETGYYTIPRQISTQELADEFGISDQAVTERLRRAIVTLVENSLVVADAAAERDDD